MIEALEQVGSGALNLPLMEEPCRPEEYVRMILCGARDEGWDFEPAWAAAVNRLQPSQMGGEVEDGLAESLREARLAIEEERPAWQAAYEDREMTSVERASIVTAAWRRYDGPVTSIGRSRRPHGV